MSPWHAVVLPEEPAEGALVGARVAGQPLVLVRTEGRWFALSDECTHAGCAISEDGELVGGALICNCHGAEFAVETGAVLEGPADGPLETYPVRVVEGVVEVNV